MITAWCDFDLGLDSILFENEKIAREYIRKVLEHQGVTDPTYMDRLEEDGLLTFKRNENK